MSGQFFCKFQSLVPQHGLSKLVGKIAKSKKIWLKNCLIKTFLKFYPVKLDEALQTDVEDYPTFNDFFIRRIKPELRPIDSVATLTSPVDGYVSEFGKIQNGFLLQAKEKLFDLSHLLCDTSYRKEFSQGNFITLYLAPHQYHRVHMPIEGRLLKMFYLRGRLFSVNDASVRNISELFCHNERIVFIFETELGPMIIVMVGALLVSGMVTSFSGQIASHTKEMQNTRDFLEQNLILQKGQELGYFEFGSTVILLLPNQAVIEWSETLSIGKEVKMGAPLTSN